MFDISNSQNTHILSLKNIKEKKVKKSKKSEIKKHFF